MRGALRRGRHGLMGHLYPGMLDVSTDLTLVSVNFGGHVEVLEFDDLRVRVERRHRRRRRPADGPGPRPLRGRRPASIDEDFRWAAQVSLGLDRLVEDFGLDSLAYYHRGLDGEMHERLGAGMILGASLLTARGIPAVGEYELRTSLAMLVVDRFGGGGSFTEFQALNFLDNVVEMGHDGPAHLAISDTQAAAARPRRLPRQARLGGVGRVRRAGTDRSPWSASPSSATVGTGSSSPRARSCPDRCCRSATPPPASTSAAIPGEWMRRLERDRDLAPLGAGHRRICPSSRGQIGATARVTLIESGTGLRPTGDDISTRRR